MDEITQKLMGLKQAIENAKTEAARVEGQIQQLENQRTTDLGCSTDEEAEAYLIELKQNISQLQQELNEGIEALKDELGWEIE